MSGSYPPGPPNQPYGQQPGPYGPPPGQGGPPPGQGGPPPGYSFGPFAGQPPPAGPGGPYGPVGPGGPGGPYQPYGPGPGQPPPRKRSKLPIIIAAAAVALVLLVTAIVFAVRRSTEVVGQPPTPPPTTEPAPPTTGPATEPPTSPPTTAPTTAPTGPPPPAGPTASDAVTGYLRALAAGNADAALRYAARPQARDATTTNAVLADSRRRAPISRIAVTPNPDPNARRVRATYLLGRTPVNTVYEVQKVGTAWKLSTVVNDISVGVLRDKSVPMKVNGATVTADTIRVLPGSYAFSTGSGYLSYGKRNVVTVRSPTDLVVGVYGLRRQLTSSGIKKVRSEARERWNQCLDSRSPRPTNCPFRWTDPDYRYINGTVNWSRSGADPFKKATVGLDPARGPALSVRFRVRISGDCRFDGQRGTCRGSVSGLALGKIDLTKPSAAFDWL